MINIAFTFSLSLKTPSNAWDSIQKSREIIQPYTSIKQGKREPLREFYQILTKNLQGSIGDPEARSVWNESPAFENDNIKCKRILGMKISDQQQMHKMDFCEQ